MAAPLADSLEDEKEIDKSDNKASNDLEQAQKKDKMRGSRQRRGYPPRFRPYVGRSGQ